VIIPKAGAEQLTFTQMTEELGRMLSLADRITS
jgi:hypothetical protein